MNPSNIQDPYSGFGPFPSGLITADQFTAEELQFEESIAVDLMQSHFPELDLTPGSTMYEFWVRPGAVLAASIRKAASRYRKSTTFKGLGEFPPGDPDLVAADYLLSNYFEELRLGKNATGLITVFISSSRFFRIDVGSIFTTEGGLTYRAIEEVSGSGDTLLAPASDLWALRVRVEATAPGGQFNIPTGVEFQMSNPASGFVRAVSTYAFAGGESVESLTEVSGRVMASLSARNMVSEAAIFAAIKDVSPQTEMVKVVGFGDPLMTRNKMGAGGFPIGGIVDAYIKTSNSIVTRFITKTATKVAGTTNYSFSIGRADYPGHYGVRSILPVSGSVAGTFRIVSEIRSPDKIGDELESRIVLDSDISFSVWQKTNIVFSVESADPVSSSSETIEVAVEVWGLPDLDKAQDLLSDPVTRVAATDYMAKAFVPAIVSCSKIAASVDPSISALDAEAMIRSAFEKEIASIPVGGRVRVDRLVSAIMSIEGVHEVDLPLKVSADVYHPIGVGYRNYSSTTGIDIATEASFGYGPGNTTFFTDQDGISVQIRHTERRTG
jgi:hypothetical protein